MPDAITWIFEILRRTQVSGGGMLGMVRRVDFS